jgi:hypothetical protein
MNMLKSNKIGLITGAIASVVAMSSCGDSNNKGSGSQLVNSKNPKNDETKNKTGKKPGAGGASTTDGSTGSSADSATGLGSDKNTASTGGTFGSTSEGENSDSAVLTGTTKSRSSDKINLNLGMIIQNDYELAQVIANYASYKNRNKHLSEKMVSSAAKDNHFIAGYIESQTMEKDKAEETQKLMESFRATKESEEKSELANKILKNLDIDFNDEHPFGTFLARKDKVYIGAQSGWEKAKKEQEENKKIFIANIMTNDNKYDNDNLKDRKLNGEYIENPLKNTSQTSISMMSNMIRIHEKNDDFDAFFSPMDTTKANEILAKMSSDDQKEILEAYKDGKNG